MDKIMRRVRMAERRVLRRAQKQEDSGKAAERWQHRNRVVTSTRQAGRQLAIAIKHRHEDWESGPIAPRRDVSRIDESGNYWGSITAEQANGDTPLITEEQLELRSAWAGGPKTLCLAVNDRVVILDGPYKGKLSKVKSINKKNMTAQLDEDILTNQTIPDYMRPADLDHVEAGPSAIPISSLRLVHPLPDPTTGIVRDVIVRQLKPISIVHDRPTRKVSYSRIIPGENVKIPWPKIEPRPKFEYDCDTKRAEVEERTYVPTLLTPPMPQSVLDELRGRYSKFRTRHEPEYIAKIEAQEAEKEARKKSAKTMLLPVQELNRKLRAERRALGQPVLTEEMLEKIGQVIAKNRAMRAAGKNPVVDNVQKAVEQLSIEDQAAPETKDQPRA
ncbi:hypothetical protein QBC34DRAFT_391398 [Podospora aff. communis PSN243]|uniref:KOW domain-containing protein n=1 Tax=Podospora aff. communis PSN243 TaxID=3040156 RepID=A0AAV9H472_9PEZI|nr:hypothetical protein QBC34DRAFT_391398 [Podospora aff. communis PSN243]